MKKTRMLISAFLTLAGIALAEQYTLTGEIKYSDKHGYYWFQNDEWWMKVLPENAQDMDLSKLPQGDVTITFEADEIRTLGNGKQRPKDINGWKLLNVEE
jgi:hypothetical protein